MENTLNYSVNETRSREMEDIHKDWNAIWYGLNSTYNFGCCTYLYKKYDCPTTYQAFYDAYTTDCTANYGKTNGRTPEYILKQAYILSKRDNNSYPIKDYYDYIVKKLIIDTMDGSKRELEVKELFEKHGYTCTEPTFEQDTKEGVDKFLYKDGVLKYIIQVKPHTFFIGNYKQDLINDRLSALKKEQICKQKYNVPVIYIVYNKNTGDYERNERGGIGWKLTTLIDSNGKSDNRFAD